MSIDPIAAIPESSARGEIAEIYGDIRQALGVDVVNLVWRHLATIDGALPWAWQSVRPAYVAGVVSAEADRMKAALEPPRLVDVPSDVLSAAGIGHDDVAKIRTVLSSYDRSNAMNFLALSALVQDAGGAASNDNRIMAEAAPGSVDSIGVMPSLPPLDRMTPALRDLLHRLNALGETDDQWIMVSMYRHLSYWPGYLALIWSLLAPLAADGRLQSTVQEVEELAATHCANLAGSLAGGPVHQPCRQALSSFLQRVRLPKMIVVTRLLLDATAAIE